MRTHTSLFPVPVSGGFFLRQKNHASHCRAYCFRFLLLATVTLTAPCSSAFGQVELLKDLNPLSSENYGKDHMLTHGGDRLYFVDNNQLWTSTGDIGQTSKLMDFRSIYNLRFINGTLYFTADDGFSGQELWKSNGTIASTLRVKDISPGLAASSPSAVCNVMGKLFFAARNDSYGRELWVTDGTDAGTRLVRDIRKGKGNSNPDHLTEMNGMVFFSANDGTRGRELWKSDGDARGTSIVRDIATDHVGSANPEWLTAIGQTLYFTAAHSKTGVELWKTDGSNTGTMRVKDILPGERGSGIENLINVKGTLFFTADDGLHGDELWKSDGFDEGTVLVRDMNPGRGGSNVFSMGRPNMHAFTDINGILYFVAYRKYDYRIYRSDGTREGTFPVQSLFPPAMDTFQPAFTWLNGKVYFFSRIQRDEPYYLQSMDYDGNTPEPVRAFAPPDDFYDPFHQEMISFGGKLFTFGRLMSTDWQYSPFKFISSDGTSEGTVVIKDVEKTMTYGSNPFRMTSSTDLLYIQTLSETTEYPGRYELFRTDGTVEGTFSLMNQGQEHEMLSSGNRLFFGGQAENESALYVTEGTTESIRRLTPGSTMANGKPSLLTDVNGVVYFANNYTFQGASYSLLWKTDGTPEGTRMLLGTTRTNSITRVGGKIIALTESGNDLFIAKSIRNSMVWVATITSGASRPAAYQPTAVIDMVMYFVATDGAAHGNEIWRTDGSNAGTYMLFDFNPNDPVNEDLLEDDIRALIAVRKSLYFNAKAAGGEWGLYKYVAPSSYDKITEMPPVVTSLVVNRLMYLFTESEQPGTLSLWVSDGTTQGTRFISNFQGDKTVNHTVLDGIVYFSSPEARQMFRSDGTVCGTYEVNTGLEGAFPVAAFGNAIVFGAYSEQTGTEPFIYRNISSDSEVPCAELTTEEFESVSGARLTHYPNPFTEDFTLRINGEENAPVNIIVRTLQGLDTERLIDLKTNTDYPDVGRAWPKGIYLVTVYMNDKVTSHMLIKK